MKDMTQKDVVSRIYDYADVVQTKQDEYFTRNGFTHSPSDKIEVKLGRRYAKIVKLDRAWDENNEPIACPGRGGSVHTFVDINNGDILKAASWQAPAPNGVRGNIFSEDYGASVVNEHGANYKYAIG
tara:strand:- start:141 stop:521 length:381 start_codon:yes stop_codon:yes gene_type:complete